MFTPLISIKFDSIYGGPLPSRMAKCTPDTYAALFAVKKKLKEANSDLVLSDLFRSYEMQYQANQDYVTGKKTAFSPPPGGSMHEAGRAFDLDLKYIKKMGLSTFWTLARPDGMTPILKQPDIGASEAWHFDVRGSHAIVYDYYANGHGDNFKSPYTAMAASAIISNGQKVDQLGEDVLPAYIQSGLIRLGHIIGDLDGRIGQKTNVALQMLDIDPDADVQKIAAEVDAKLQTAFPAEFFIPGTYIDAGPAPAHLIVDADVLPAPATIAPIGYAPHPASVAALGKIVSKLAQAKVIQQSFVHAPKILAQLKSKELYFDSNLELDTDGWPSGAGDKNWQKDTSLRYAKKGSLDANRVPYFVLPLPAKWAADFGISLGDYAAVIYKQRVAFAVFADQGPTNKLGEGSIQLLRQLGQERLKSDGRILNAGMGPDIVTIVFPGSGKAADRADEATLIDAINTKGKILLDKLRA